MSECRYTSPEEISCSYIFDPISLARVELPRKETHQTHDVATGIVIARFHVVFEGSVLHPHRKQTGKRVIRKYCGVQADERQNIWMFELTPDQCLTA
jgi:hypothetical protein